MLCITDKHTVTYIDLYYIYEDNFDTFYSQQKWEVLMSFVFRGETFTLCVSFGVR